MKIGLAQMEVQLNKGANLNHIHSFIEKAAAQDIDLIVFPEASMYNFGTPKENLHAQSEALEGPFVAALCNMAAQYNIFVMVGMFESPVVSNRVFNTLVLIDDKGRMAGKYRKIHLFDALEVRESSRMQPGDGATLLFECRGMKIGAMTCYDVRFPELARYLAVRGADAIVIPSAWYAGPLKDMQLEVLCRARAIENNIYIAACVQTGADYTGSSMIIDPMGVVLSSLPEGEGLMVGEFNHHRVRDVRTKSPTLSNRREEIYSGWL